MTKELTKQEEKWKNRLQGETITESIDNGEGMLTYRTSCWSMCIIEKQDTSRYDKNGNYPAERILVVDSDLNTIEFDSWKRLIKVLNPYHVRGQQTLVSKPIGNRAINGVPMMSARG